jgi:hypothetical protein
MKVLLAAAVASFLLWATATASAGVPRADAAAAKDSAVFYTGHGKAGYDEAQGHAAHRLDYKTFTADDSDCRTSRPFPNTNRTIRTLAGYSSGRLGPIYYLNKAGRKQREAVRYVLLLDPGSFGEFQGGCDAKLDVDGILASWLKLNSSNRLVVIAADSSLGVKEPGLYNGIRSYYFRKIVSQGQAGKALVCNVESNGVPYSHVDVKKKFMGWIDRQRTGCDGFYGWRPGQLPYANTIVKWNNEKPSPRTSWLVGADGKRRWIADGGTFNCIAGRVGGARLLMASVLDKLPDQHGERASCAAATPPATPVDQPLPPDTPAPPGSPSVSLAQGPAAPAGFRYAITVSGFAPGTSVPVSCHDSKDPGGFFNFSMTTDGGGSASTQSQCYSGDGPDHWAIAGGHESNHVSWGGGAPAPPPPAPAPSTWAEQQGSLGANTFTNPYNASGMGVKIQPYQWVDVSCKVYAPQIASANPDGYWYRIRSSPWNDAYYAVANTFWNGDVPGVKPYTHNTDFAVANC